MYQSRQRRGGLGVYLLGYQLLTMNDRLPPVTLLTVVLQVAIYLGFIPALDLDKIRNICVSPHYVWQRHQWSRLLFATVVHVDDMHLYYNMISFMWKGRRLERRFGSEYFAYLLVVFSVLTNVVLVAISILAEEHLGLHYGLLNQCAVGFSGVIFALKVLSNHYFPVADNWIFGMFPVPSRLACWAELFLIQMLVPNASFVGHLAGILVGMAYVTGPLKTVMDVFVPSRDLYDRSQYQRPSSSQNADYTRYTGGLSEEEQLRRAYEESANTRYRSPPYPTYPSAPPYHS